MEMERGNAASRKRIETQVLHLESDSWRPYTYTWNDAQTDAALAPADGESKILTIRDTEAPGGQRRQTYRIHSSFLPENPLAQPRGDLVNIETCRGLD